MSTVKYRKSRRKKNLDKLTEQQLDDLASEWFLFGPLSDYTEEEYVEIMRRNGRTPEYVPHPNDPRHFEQVRAAALAKLKS